MVGMSASDSVKRKRSGNDVPSITIPAAKRQKSSKGMSITIKRKSTGGAATASASAPTGALAGAQAGGTSRVKELGTRMWTAVRAAQSKELSVVEFCLGDATLNRRLTGISLSTYRGLEVAHDFLKLPPKRQYPDYYLHIKQPICLDDIRVRERSLTPILA